MGRIDRPQNTQAISDRVSRGTPQHREIDRFESLVSELSAAMTRAAAHEVDLEIDTWLAKICQALDLDRSAIYERDAPGEPVRTTHTWLRPNFPAFPRNFDPETLVKATTNWVMAGKQLIFSRPSDIPDELGDARRFVERYGPKASAVIPMWAGSQVIGAASFGRFRSTREWQPELLEQLAFAVRLFGGAIERKQSEIALRAARTELRIASRRNMISQLVASIAHEVNQPLGAILSNAQAARRFLATERPNLEDLKAAIEDIIQDNFRAVETMRNIRALFQRDEAQMSAVDLRQILNDVERILAAEATLKNVTLSLDLPATLPTVIGNRTQLVQALMNLVLNAFDAVCENGNGPREVEIRASQHETGRVHIAVRDSGNGINPEVMPKLFDAFFTTKPNGMGMGLAIVRSIVENHGGRLWATRNPDRGATLEFELPAKAKAESKN